jgi:Bax protein
MQLDQVLAQENQNLTEALGKWGTLGALGLSAALGAYGGSAQGSALAKSLLGKSAPGQERVVSPSVQLPLPAPSLLPTAPEKTTTAGLPLPPIPPKVVPTVKPSGKDVHPNFPPALQSQPTAAPGDKINSFVQNLLPSIREINQEILRDRTTLKSIMQRQSLTPAQQTWLEDKMTRYRANNVRELLQKMDVIPPSLVLSQAGLESGWGTSDISRQFNAFFGQKTWGDKNAVIAPGGERYQTFDNPTQSIRSYIQNLNSHPAYQSLRQTRAQLRKTNKPLTGDVLATGLEKYSTKGKDYVRQVQGMIRGRKWTDLDKNH